MDVTFWCVWILLLIAAIFDLIWKRIPILLITIGGLVAGMFCLKGEQQYGDIIFSLLPGAIMLLLSWMSKEKVGYGDGFIVLELGAMEGLRACITDLLLGLSLVSGVGILLMIFLRKKKETEIPFVPFLAVAHACRLFLGW